MMMRQTRIWMISIRGYDTSGKIMDHNCLPYICGCSPYRCLVHPDSTASFLLAPIDQHGTCRLHRTACGSHQQHHWYTSFACLAHLELADIAEMQRTVTKTISKLL